MGIHIHSLTHCTLEAELWLTIRDEGCVTSAGKAEQLCYEVCLRSPYVSTTTDDNGVKNDINIVLIIHI